MIQMAADHGVNPSNRAAMFERSVEGAYDDAFRLAYAVLRSRSEAEDAVQEAVARAWAHFASFDESRDFRPWFFTIVANQCRSELRRPWRRVLLVGEILSRTRASDPMESIRTRQAMAKLDASSRMALMLRFYLDLDYAAIAEALRVSEQAARVRVSRALGKLRRALGEEST